MPRISTDNYDTVTSWNGSQDLFIVEQPDGTKVATPEQVKQYVLNNMDEVPTEDSDKPVKSGGVFSAIDDIKAVKVTDIFSASPTRSGAYIITSGSTVDITSFVSSNDWECWVFPVVPGDSFVITVEGGGAPRAYCFIDENGNVLSRAAASARLTQELITAEKKGFCIIQNFVVTVPNPSIVGTLAVSNSAYAKIGAEMAKTLDVNSTSFDIASKLPVGRSAAVIVSDSSLCTAFASDTNSLSGVVSRLASNVYAWHLVTFNYKFIYVRTDASFTVSRRFYAAGTSF